MILHVSLPVKDPRNAANYLAQLVNGVSKPLNWCPGGYMVFTDDQVSTGIELLPFDTVFKPGKTSKDTLTITTDINKPSFDCVHFLLVVQNKHEDVMNIANDAGWQAVAKRSLGVVDMIELWVENRIMIEVTFADKQTETIHALNSQHYQGCD